MGGLGTPELAAGFWGGVPFGGLAESVLAQNHTVSELPGRVCPSFRRTWGEQG